VVDHDSLRRHNVEAIDAACRAAARSDMNPPRRVEGIGHALHGSGDCHFALIRPGKKYAFAADACKKIFAIRRSVDRLRCEERFHGPPFRVGRNEPSEVRILADFAAARANP